MKLTKAEHRQMERYFLHCFGIPKAYFLSDNVGTANWSLEMLHKLARKKAITYDLDAHGAMTAAFGVKFCHIRLTPEGAQYMRDNSGLSVLR